MAAWTESSRVSSAGVLRGDADRAAPGVAVRAATGRGAERRVVGSDVDRRAVGIAVRRPVAAQREEGGHPDGHGVGAERQRLGHIGARADSSGHDQLHLVTGADIPEGLGGHAHGGQGGDAGVLDEDVLGGRRAALHAVDHHDIGAGGDGELHVVIDAGRPDLHVHGD